MWATLARREAEEAEDDVLDPRLEEVLAVRDDLARLLAEQPEDHREVVHAERPERVLVRADHPRGSGGSRRRRRRRRARPRRRAPSPCAGRGGRAAGGPASARGRRARASSTSSSISSPRIAGGFSTKTCLPASSASLRELVVGRHRRRDHDRLDGRRPRAARRVGRHACSRVALRELGPPVRVGVADPGEVGELADDPHDVLAPPAEPDVGDAGHSFQTFSLATPARPVALRRSTTSCASSTSCA